MQPASMPQPVMMSQHAFKVMALSPEVSAEQPASKKLSEQKISYQKESDAKAGNLGNMTYATVSFIEPEIQAEQQRIQPSCRPAIRTVITSTYSAAERRKGATRPTITSITTWDRR